MASMRRTSMPNEGPSLNACLPCRSVKMKCRVDPANTICDRCLRKSLDCVFEKHRRGRKRGTKVKKHLGEASQAEGLQASPSQSRDIPISNSTHFGAVEGPKTVSDSANTVCTHSVTYSVSSSSNTHTAPEPWATPGGGLQPAELLNREAKGGKFSLQNILSVPDEDDVDPNLSRKPTVAASGDYGSDDPINAGVLAHPIAVGLFDHFMRCQNPFLSQLDPKLHTFDYVRRKSSFLLSSIFTATAKAFHPSLYSQLRNHRDMLLGKAFSHGDKSVEVVQAIMVLTYWKEPDETRTWLLIGYAIRMCLELGWHELRPNWPDDPGGQDEISAREARNIQRTWLVLFVYDRSLSSQMGKPWMIDQNDLIRRGDSWLASSIAAPGIDVLLGGFVRLRIMHCEIIQLVNPNLYPSVGAPRQGTETPMKLFNIDLTVWENHWVSLLGREDEHPCQRFLLKFYGTHLRLLLNSFSLQESLGDSTKGLPISKSALWICFSSAVGMMDLISKEFGPLKLLYFAQDSVHVMTAYAAIFLIKLLLSLPAQLRTKLEGVAIVAIQNAGDTFKEQSATPRTGCALQARFLTNVVEKYETMRSKTQSSTASQPELTNPPTSHAEEIQNPTPASNVQDQVGESAEPANNHFPRDQFMSGTMPHDGFFAMNQEMGYDPEQVAYSFADNDMWELMFADAGFRINEGVFMNDNTMMDS